MNFVLGTDYRVIGSFHFPDVTNSSRDAIWWPIYFLPAKSGIVANWSQVQSD